MTQFSPASVELSLATEHWPLRAPFHIAGHTFHGLDVLVVSLARRGQVGRGEAAGVYYFGDTAQSMAAQVETCRSRLEAGLTRDELRAVLPPGGARNAVDCALWDLEAKLSGDPVWRLAGLDQPRPLLTTYTIGVDAPEAMAQRALEFADARALKLKLSGDPADAARVLAVRCARPEVWLGVDANQGLDLASYDALLPALCAADVRLLEQPFPRFQDYLLDGLGCSIPIAADESVQTADDLAELEGRVQVINIKLDKCGGLTEGLAMAHEARRRGFDVMVGNMVGTVLAMAPAFVLGQLCDIVDLDGPLALANDRRPGTEYAHGQVNCPAESWGAP